MLRLAHPAPRGQGTDPPKRRKYARAPALSFTPEEVRHVRAALRNAARAYGGADVLATVMGVRVEQLYQASAQRRPSGIFAIRLAAAAGRHRRGDALRQARRRARRCLVRRGDLPLGFRRVTAGLDSYTFARVERLVTRTGGPRGAQESRSRILRQCTVYRLRKVEAEQRADGRLRPLVWPLKAGAA